MKQDEPKCVEAVDDDRSDESGDDEEDEAEAEVEEDQQKDTYIDEETNVFKLAMRSHIVMVCEVRICSVKSQDIIVVLLSSSCLLISRHLSIRRK